MLRRILTAEHRKNIALAIRLLALDLDGTILDAHMQFSPRVRRALRLAEEAGVHVTLASGRFFPSMRAFAADLGIHEPLICLQGAVVQDPISGRVHFHCGVPLALAYEFIDLVRARGWDLALYQGDLLCAERMTLLLEFYAGYSPVREEVHVVADLRAFLDSDPLKLVVVAEPEQAAVADAQLRERFAGRLHVVRSFCKFVEATNLAVSKGQALAFLAQKLGVAQSETMAIGDNDNDADMVAWAGLGVAVGNASPKVMQAARYVAAPMEQDGAAEAIERFILAEQHA